MIFTDVSTERAIKAFRKVGFKIVTKSKHFGMSDGTHRITIPNHKGLTLIPSSLSLKAPVLRMNNSKNRKIDILLV